MENWGVTLVVTSFGGSGHLSLTLNLPTFVGVTLTYPLLPRHAGNLHLLLRGLVFLNQLKWEPP